MPYMNAMFITSLILTYDLGLASVLLVRQFGYPIQINRVDDLLIFFVWYVLTKIIQAQIVRPKAYRSFNREFSKMNRNLKKRILTISLILNVFGILFVPMTLILDAILN